MKSLRKLASVFLTCAIVAAMGTTAAAAPALTIAINGEAVTASAYINSDARTMVPVTIGDALGLDYTYNDNSVTFSRLGLSQTYTVGTPVGDTVPALTNGAIHVPFYHLAQTFGFQVGWDAAARRASAESQTYPTISVDTENRDLYASEETGVQSEFGWYTWEFEIDPAMDTVGVTGDGIGLLRFRLYTPESVEAGKEYPLVATLGGLGGTNAFASNGYASSGSAFASASFQTENPCYVLNITVPFEACVNYEAELAYIYQFGEIIKAIAASYGNVDMDRIYATGHSQGAGWSYELASVQPDLLDAMLINAGSTIHTTWGNQCDMQAIADSGVNVYIWHGYPDPYIPVNEAYRAYNTLIELGKTNLIMEIDNCKDITSYGGHCNISVYSTETITPYMQWLFDQTLGSSCTDAPALTEDDNYSDYAWAGVQVLPSIEGWATANPYATWTEPKENATWNQVMAGASALAGGSGGTGKTWLSKIRIGDETATSYDDATTDAPTVTISKGDSVAVTVQGYTGGYGDDWTAFNNEWDVEWAVLEGSVTNVELTHAASDTPILRPASVSLANGGGPNVNNSLYNENALDGNQVYLRIDTAEAFQCDSLKVAIRFIRDLGNGEYASYWHVVQYAVQ